MANAFYGGRRRVAAASDAGHRTATMQSRARNGRRTLTTSLPPSRSRRRHQSRTYFISYIIIKHNT